MADTEYRKNPWELWKPERPKDGSEQTVESNDDLPSDYRDQSPQDNRAPDGRKLMGDPEGGLFYAPPPKEKGWFDKLIDKATGKDQEQPEDINYAPDDKAVTKPLIASLDLPLKDKLPTGKENLGHETANVTGGQPKTLQV